MNYKATVTQAISALQKLAILYAHRGNRTTAIPVARPFMGGLAQGFHTYPPQGSQVLVMNELHDFPIGTISVTDTPAKLFALASGESVILGSDGRQVCYLKADGTTTLWQKGTTRLYLDAAGHLISSQSTPPTIQALSGGLGAGGTATLNAGATDLRGTMTLTTAASGFSTNAAAQVTFATPFAAAPYVMVVGSDKNTATLKVDGFTVTTNGFQVQFASTPTASTTYTLTYFVIG